jgi:hypothetical protein
MEFTSLWDEAGATAEQDAADRRFTAARVACAPVWGFLAAAKSREEFGNRFALVEDRVRYAADEHGADFRALAASLAEDFRSIEPKTANGEIKGGKSDCSHDWAFDNSCKKCGARLSFPKKAVRTLAIYKVTAGDSSAYYVVDTDTDKKVGGPYDSKEDAQDAISGGDVEGDNLSVSKGGGDDSDSDDSDDEPRDSDGDSDDSDDSDSDSDSDDEDSKGGGNPFAKGSSRKVAVGTHSIVHEPGTDVFVPHWAGDDVHGGQKGVWASVVATPADHGHEDRADSHLLKPKKPGGSLFFHHFGSLGKTAAEFTPWHETDAGKEHARRILQSRRAEFKSGLGSYSTPAHDMPEGHHQDWRPHQVYDSVGSLLNHQGHFEGSDNPAEHRDSANAHYSDMSSFNHCPSCDHAYSTEHPDHVMVGAKHQCPNCGDTDHHEHVGDILAEGGHYQQRHERTTYDDPGPDYHGMDGDNYGDPYGKFDEGSPYHQHMHGSRKVAETIRMTHPEYCGAYVHGGPVCTCGQKTPDGQTITPYPDDYWHDYHNNGGKKYSPKKANLRPVVALPDGVDPLEWIVQTVPSGEGEPEKPVEHDEHGVYTATLVERFRDVYDNLVTE